MEKVFFPGLEAENVLREWISGCKEDRYEMKKKAIREFEIHFVTEKQRMKKT